jgi:hypothetical protein
MYYVDTNYFRTVLHILYTLSLRAYSSYNTHCNGWLVYSCYSHLEHRTSLKRFVSFQFFNLRHLVGLLERVISPSQCRYLTQTSMPRLGFQPMIPAFDEAETVHALDCAATVIIHCNGPTQK